MAVVDPRIRFEDVAAAALAQAFTLLPEWMGGKREGNEWKAERRENGGPGDSWTVSLTTGKWLHGAGTEKGGDLVSLYAALNDMDNIEALPIVGAALGMNGSHAIRPTAPRSAPESEDPGLELIPVDAGPMPSHHTHGEPTQIFRYGNEFVICRYDTGEKKVFNPYRWRKGKWLCRAAPSPKRLYNIEELKDRPLAQILIVEGEKCVEALRHILSHHIIVTWAGGSNATKKNRWEALAGRTVLIWPDADKAGNVAAAEIKQQLMPIAKSVRVIRPPDNVPEGWDLADAVADGWDSVRILEWMHGHVSGEEIPKPQPHVLPGSEVRKTEPKNDYIARADQSDEYEFGVPTRAALVVWQQLGLAAPLHKMPHSTLSNASIIIRRHLAFCKKFWLDSFRDRIYHTLDGEPKELNDTIVRRITAYVQESMQLPKFSFDVMYNGIVHAAECNARNSLLDWLNSLQWDGVSRLDDWLVDSLGIEKTGYTMAVSRNWPISMVARAYQPGCQADHMPILEDRMGEGKSSFLKILGGEWFGSITKPIGDTAFIEDIQGLWLVEIPDMTGFGKREHSLILATVTTLTDRQRPPYGRTTQNYKRQCIFAATSETSDWLQEGRGSRRFWPLTCGKVGKIDLDNLRANRDSIFAEAVHHYKAGATWHEVPREEAEREQLARTSSDPWAQKVYGYAMTQPVQMDGRTMVYVDRILSDEQCIGMPIGHQDGAAQKRIIRILKADGWETDKYKGHRCWTKILR